MARRKKTQETEVLTIAQLEARNASEPKFGKGIALAAGFDLGGKSALDSRSTVATIAERNAHVTGNRAYEGMMVYVEEDKKTYQLIDGNWKQFGFDVEQFEASVEDSLTSNSTTSALSANQGRVLNEKITAQGATINQINGKVTSIETTVGEIQESLEGLGTDLTSGLETLGNRVTVVERDMTQAKLDITTLKADMSAAESDITALEEGLAAEIARATEAEQALNTKIDSEVAGLEAADTAINAAVVAAQAKADKVASDLAAETAARTAADSALDTKIAANTAAINKEVTDRKAEITRVEGLITSANSDLSDEITALKAKDTALEQRISTEETNRVAEDERLSQAISGLDTRVDSIEEELAGIELTWDRVTNKPFDTVGKTLKVSSTKQLDVKVDDATIGSKKDGTLEVKDGVFAPFLHNHDSAYASKAHELNQEIHLTASEKLNVAKIPTMETDISALKSTVGSVSQHHIVMTFEEMEDLENTNHGDICHVVETKKTYILDKQDVDGDLINPEWIELADFNSLVTVDWSIINNKPFATVGEGLQVVGDAIKVVADGSTVEIKEGKVAVKEGVFAAADHTHTVAWEEVTNKPTIFSKNCAVSEWVEEEGLVSLTVSHAKNSTNVIVKVLGADNIERLVAVEHLDANSIKIWSDEKEAVSVTVFSYDFGSASPSTHSALVGRAITGKAVVGRK